MEQSLHYHLLAGEKAEFIHTYTLVSALREHWTTVVSYTKSATILRKHTYQHTSTYINIATIVDLLAAITTGDDGPAIPYEKLGAVALCGKGEESSIVSMSLSNSQDENTTREPVGILCLLTLKPPIVFSHVASAMQSDFNSSFSVVHSSISTQFPLGWRSKPPGHPHRGSGSLASKSLS